MCSFVLFVLWYTRRRRITAPRQSEVRQGGLRICQTLEADQGVRGTVPEMMHDVHVLAGAKSALGTARNRKH